MAFFKRVIMFITSGETVKVYLSRQSTLDTFPIPRKYIPWVYFTMPHQEVKSLQYAY